MGSALNTYMPAKPTFMCMCVGVCLLVCVCVCVCACVIINWVIFQAFHAL